MPDLEPMGAGRQSILVKNDIEKVSYGFLGTTIPRFLYPSVVSSDGATTLQLDRSCIDRLNRFQERTVLSIGAARTANLYQDIAVNMALSVGLCP